MQIKQFNENFACFQWRGVELNVVYVLPLWFPARETTRNVLVDFNFCPLQGPEGKHGSKNPAKVLRQTATFYREYLHVKVFVRRLGHQLEMQARRPPGAYFQI